MNFTANPSIDFPNKLRYRQLLIAVFIVLLAFGLRTVVVFQRAAYDPSFIPQNGTDHARYLSNAEGVLAGTWPDKPHYFHPAPAYVYAAIYAVLGTKSLMSLSLVLALFDALGCGFLIAAAWLVTKKEYAGYLTGLLYAFYPVAMLYATTPLTEPIAGFLLALFCFLTLWQGEKLRFWRSLLLGFVAGGIALSRLNLVPVVALYGLWLLMLRLTWRERFLHGSVFVFVACLVIAPITWQNAQLSGGQFIPVATTGSLELYMANNRDSSGRQGRSPALDSIDLGYMDAVIRDAQVAPEHFFGLLAYKFALFWSVFEPGNNVNFDESAATTPLLQIPINFLVIAALGLLGFVGIWQQNRRAAFFLALMLAWICLSYVLSFAFGRIRFPAIVPLVIMAGGLLLIRELKRLILPAILIAALFGLSHWLLTPFPKLPPERTYSALPADAIPLNAQFGEIVLLGWRSLGAWPAAENGYIAINEAYAIELFWQLPAETEKRYQFFLAYVDEGERWVGIDRPIGAISFPEWTTEEWQAGTILGEIVSIRLDGEIPQARSGQIRLGVWYRDDADSLVNVPMANGDNDLLLQRLAVFNPLRPPEAPNLPPSHIIFGETIALLGYSIPERAQTGETISLSFYWEALHKIPSNYSLFLHVVDESGEIAAQGDNNPVLPLFTSNWIPNYPLLGELPLTMPTVAGTYEIYGGLYNEGGRLSVDAPDNRIFLGTIELVAP
jgi:4-amino-4-deoxy-L-arabinose transferase-like glycosyltransferase